MKLSIETCDIVKRFGEEKAFEMIKNAGFDCIDYSFYWLDEPFYSEVLGDDYLNHAKKTRALLDKAGLTCNQAHAPLEFDISNDTIDLSNDNYKRIVKSLEIASILGAEAIVVHAVLPKDGETALETNYKFYKSFEPYLEKFNIKIAVENLFYGPYDSQKYKYTNNLFGRPYLMKEIIEKLDSKWFVCCIDVGHATITDIEPQDFIRGMDNKLLRHLHIQDNDNAYDKHWLPYVGVINWDEVTKSLKEIDYKGDITFEIFHFLKRFDDEMIPDVLAFAEKTGRYLIKKIENA